MSVAKIAVVTGGARGIGKAVCEKLAREGATVVINYSRSEAPANALVETIRAQDGQAHAICFDVADSNAVEQGFKKIIANHGQVDVLVNNAGISIDSLIARAKVEDWQKVIDVNLAGAFYCSRAVAKSMMKARGGRIINISSVIGQMGNAGQAAYSASKAGLFGLTKSLARELGSRNVTVNAIAPGYIVTDMTGSLGEDVKESLLSNIPLGRLGTTEDIAEAVSFLCSSGGSYITGQVLAVNGGMYM